MKKLLLSLLFVCASIPALASVGQVAQLNATGSSVICIPGPTDQVIVIQNNGSNSVRISFDGGAGYVDPVTGKVGTNPTPTTGYLLTAGQQLILSSAPYTNASAPGLHKPIVAIMVTSTTTLDIITDGTQTQFPTK